MTTIDRENLLKEISEYNPLLKEQLSKLFHWGVPITTVDLLLLEYVRLYRIEQKSISKLEKLNINNINSEHPKSNTEPSTNLSSNKDMINLISNKQPTIIQ